MNSPTSATPPSPPPRRRALEVMHGHAALSRPLLGPTVAIGNFDGVHRGHAHLFAQIVRRAAERHGESVVLTFDPHPARVLSPAYAPPLITTLARKLELIEAAGVDVCVVEPFDRALAALSPVEFVDEVLVRSLGAAEVVVGYDFTFGHKRGGGTQLLAELGGARGFGVTIAAPVTIDGMVCSSTKVREFVLEGRVDGAALVLGRDFEVEGTVMRGAGRGRTIGVPTANLRPETELLPRTGVYAGWALVPAAGDAPSLRGEGGQLYAAAINVGHNPTFGENSLSVEAHLLDFPGLDSPARELYDQPLRLGFIARLRDERRFASVPELVAQIRADVEAARRAYRQPAAAPSPPTGTADERAG